MRVRAKGVPRGEAVAQRLKGSCGLNGMVGCLGVTISNQRFAFPFNRSAQSACRYLPLGGRLCSEPFPMHVRFDQNSISFAARRGIRSSFIRIILNEFIFSRDYVDYEHIGK